MVKLSIIIPYYKTYELTNKLLEKLVCQLNDEVEIILIDDGCNEKRLDKYLRDIKIKHLKENKGGASACNIGLDMANGLYIGFIDSDDMVSDEYIETLLNAIDNHNEDVIFMDWMDMNSGIIVHHPSNYAGWKAIYKREITPRFDENWYYSFDVPFYDKLNSKPYSKYYIDKVLYYYNSQREDNLTHRKEKERRKNMIKVEALKDFRLKRFDELVDLERKNPMKNENGKLFEGDTFYCTKEMADYLMGDNPIKTIVVKLLEVIPDEVTEEVVQAVADAIVDEAKEQDKSVEEIVKEIQEEKPKKKKGKK